MSKLEQTATAVQLRTKNMHQVIGITQEAKDKIRVACALIVKHQGQLDPKLKIADFAMNALSELQKRIESEFLQ